LVSAHAANGDGCLGSDLFHGMFQYMLESFDLLQFETVCDEKFNALAFVFFHGTPFMKD